ncbi:asparagine synthase (glutamine-hydrolyzing) [Actinoplanes sp. NPDC051346]|uniref:asparagine synthase (glutamine-hydrolyzing) n=1 Tax=Actinoplanes sp. NPDC051346 TaxID=3155048 RepID=UPI0034434673
MSGLVGWIDFARDLERQRPTVITMTATLAQRGPDAEAVWVSRHAALGYRTLAIDEPAEAQPFVVNLGDRAVAGAVTGWPTGLDTLRAKLRPVEGAGIDTAGTAELFVRAYLRWGTTFVPELTGTFAIALWDGRTDELVLVRDHLGGQPIYYVETPTGLVFGSERKALLAHPEVHPRVDAAGLREAISQALPHGGIFGGFGRVGAAEIARFDRSGWRRERYWKFTTEPHTDDYETTVATVRDMLATSVRQNLADDPSRMLVMLSGGIDSSSVAALAAEELRRRGTGPLRTFTIDFARSEFQADVMRSTNDTPFAQQVAERIGSRHTLVELETNDILDPVVRLGMLRSKDFPTRQYDMDTAQYLTVHRAAEQGCKVVFAGYGGDKYFQGATWYTHRDLVESGTFPWIALARKHGSRHGFGTGLLNAGTLAALDLPTYYADEYATAVGEVEFLPEEDPWQRKMRTIAYLMNTRFSIDAGSYAAAGLQLRSPINYHRLVQYAYNIPNAMHNTGDIEKAVLRQAVADLLPESVLRRHRSASPVSNNADYPAGLQREIAAIVADPQAPVRELIDLDRAADLAGDLPRLAKDRMARADVELTIQLNQWLDHYRVRLAL